jgi:ferredoxin
MQEFIYYSDRGLDFPLSENILVTSTQDKEQKSSFIVSNSDEVHGEVIADEIDFYISNSKDSIAKKIKNVEKLYEINAIRFDMAQDVSSSQDISKEVLLIATKEQKESFLKAMVPDEFNLFHILPDAIKSIDGHIGALNAVVNDTFKDATLKVSQVVWFDRDKRKKERSGVFDPQESSIDATLATLRENLTNYDYKKFTIYDQNICQYHERREEVCSKCEEVCPTVAIIKIDESKHLKFSQIDCHGCGGCISVCPAGALDYAPTTRESIYEMAKHFRYHTPLVVPKIMDLKSLEIDLKEDVLPLKIEGEKFLHESTFLTLLQESGSQVIFYSDFLSKGVKDSISILNQIYQKKYNKDAILVAANKEELEDAMDKAEFIENSRYSYNEIGSRKREVFSLRLRHMIGDDDLGVVTTGEHVHYAKVKVDQDKCTLCLACVGACNVDALIADPKTYELKLNASLCTACGYCEPSCPEKDCLTLERDIIELKPSWFKETTLAKDTLFACVECGVEFATTKSVEKIAAMMGPIFALASPVKQRTLYCCENCKPKLMIKEGLLNA